jgi:hypothetical protein
MYSMMQYSMYENICVSMACASFACIDIAQKARWLFASVGHGGGVFRLPGGRPASVYVMIDVEPFLVRLEALLHGLFICCMRERHHHCS